MALFKKGQVPWNKGLPKEQQPGFGNKNMLGKTHTVAVRKKISVSLKQQHANGQRSTEHLRTAEVRLKASASRTGGKHTEEAKRKISESHRKEKHYRWNPEREIVTKNADGRNDTEYRAWRLSVYKRDTFKCKIINNDCNGRIEAHHILSWAENQKLRYEVNNGITLCHFHHPRKRNDEMKLSPYFQELVKEK